MTSSVKVSADFDANSVRLLQKKLKEIDPKLRTQMLRDAKKVGEPLQRAVKTANSRIRPLSGMVNAGQFRRLIWGKQTVKPFGSVDPTTVKVQFRTAGSKKTNVTSLLRLVVPHPLMAIGQYAGRSGRSINKGYKGSGRTRVYKWRERKDGSIIERSHVIHGQGKAMIEQWRVQGRDYDAIEHALPEARSALQRIINHYEKIASDR